MLRKRRSAGCMLIAMVLAAMASAAFAADIIETAMKQPDLGTFVKAAKAAGLADAFKGGGSFTVFAPTDQAFDRLPRKTLRQLMDPGNKDKLVAVLRNHVVAGDMSANQLRGMRNGSTLATLGGGKVTITHNRSGIFVDGAKVVMTNLRASNGVIHIIDAVLVGNGK